MRVGHPEDAVESFATAVKASPDPRLQEAAWSQMGRAYLEMHHYDEAAASYKKALTLQPKDEDALLGHGLLALRSQDFKQAVADFAQAVRGDPSDVNLLLLAEALREDGQAAEAARAEIEAQKVSANLIQARQGVEGFLGLAGIQGHRGAD